MLFLGYTHGVYSVSSIARDGITAKENKKRAAKSPNDIWMSFTVPLPHVLTRHLFAGCILDGIEESSVF